MSDHWDDPDHQSDDHWESSHGMGSYYGHTDWQGAEQYDLTHTGDHITGDLADCNVWHLQSADDCSQVAQEFVLDQLTGVDHSEDEVVKVAIDHGFYTPGVGTPLDMVGATLSAYGIPNHASAGHSIDDIRNELKQDHKVLVSVDSGVLWDEAVPGHHNDHTVQVVAIDDSDKINPKIIINDPGSPDGKAVVMDAGKFYEVWGPSGNWAMFTDVGSIAPLPPLPPYQPLVAGYMNPDGTYHWGADGTNRDPTTGQIVSQSQTDLAKQYQGALADRYGDTYPSYSSYIAGRPQWG